MVNIRLGFIDVLLVRIFSWLGLCERLSLREMIGLTILIGRAGRSPSTMVCLCDTCDVAFCVRYAGCAWLVHGNARMKKMKRKDVGRSPLTAHFI
jgi:hypothetical protein